jgi:hypothetical protein
VYRLSWPFAGRCFFRLLLAVVKPQPDNGARVSIETEKHKDTETSLTSNLLLRCKETYVEMKALCITRESETAVCRITTFYKNARGPDFQATGWWVPGGIVGQ